MKKLNKIVPAALLAFTLSTLAACGCGGTSQSETDMVENTTETQSQTETAETILPTAEDNSAISDNGLETDTDMNGGNSTATEDTTDIIHGTDSTDENTTTDSDTILDDAGNAVGDVLDGAGNAVNDAVDGVTEGIDDMTGNTNNNR